MKTGNRRLKIFGKYIGPSLYISRWVAEGKASYTISFIYAWRGSVYKLTMQWPFKIICLTPNYKKEKRRELKVAYKKRGDYKANR
jgi:hypothetical protein